MNADSKYKQVCIAMFIVIFLHITYSLEAKNKPIAKQITITGEVGIVEDDGNGRTLHVALAVLEENDLVFYYVKNEGKGLSLLEEDGNYMEVKGSVSTDKENRKWILVKNWVSKEKPKNLTDFITSDMFDLEELESELNDESENDTESDSDSTKR